MDIQYKWETYLYLLQFTHNNGYQESIKMSQCEALYGHKCHVPINWDNMPERVIIGPEMSR